MVRERDRYMLREKGKISIDIWLFMIWKYIYDKEREIPNNIIINIYIFMRDTNKYLWVFFSLSTNKT